MIVLFENLPQYEKDRGLENEEWLTSLTEGFVASRENKNAPHLKFVFDPELVTNNPGDITVVDKREDPLKPLFVNTQTGAVVERDTQVVGTDGLVGCMALLALGPEKKEIVHLTPHGGANGKLGYEIEKSPSGDRIYDPTPESAHLIAEALRNAGETDLSEYRLVMAINVASDFDRQQTTLDHFKDALVGEGFRPEHIKLVPNVPLSHSALLHSEERPNEVVMIGDKVTGFTDWNTPIVDRKGEPGVCVVSLDSAIREDFGLSFPGV